MKTTDLRESQRDDSASSAPDWVPVSGVLTQPCMGTLLSRLIAALRSPYCQLYSNDPRGARFWARCAPQPGIRLGPRGTWTMKQSFASAARLRGGGPILGTALGPWLCSGHRHLGS